MLIKETSIARTQMKSHQRQLNKIDVFNFEFMTKITKLDYQRNVNTDSDLKNSTISTEN